MFIIIPIKDSPCLKILSTANPPKKKIKKIEIANFPFENKVTAVARTFTKILKIRKKTEKDHKENLSSTNLSKN